MLKINTSSIERYSVCPRYFSFSWNTPNYIPVRQEIVGNVIKSCYLHLAQKGELPPSRHLNKWLEMFVSRRAVQEKDGAPSVYKQTTNLLSMLHKWYDEEYLENYCDEGLINFPVLLNVGLKLVYSDTIDIFTTGKPPRLFDFHETNTAKEADAYCASFMYNDLVVQTRALFFSRYTKIEPESYTRYIISAQTIKPIYLKITNKFLSIAEKHIKHITQGIEQQVFYPSRSTLCDTCVFRNKCRIT